MIKVLVIDDELDLLELTTEGLRLEGFEVIPAASGIQALQLIRDNLPDIVVCDINMPGMDGFEILAALRDDLLTSAIPFIFLSALSQQHEIREGMKKGADDYLVKPVSFSELSQTIQSRLNRQSSLQMLRLREFAQRLVIAQENERRNFSSSLKDNLGDKLSDLKISLSTLLKLVDPKHSLPLQAVSTLLEDTINTINKLSYALWPSILTQLGLEAALLSLLDQHQEQSGFQLEFESYGLNDFNDPNCTIMLYRIIQAALDNIKQHAEVNTASLKVWVEDDSLHLQIEDQGRGFDLQSALNSPNKIGLLSMMERAFLLNGELNIISSQGKGTRIYGKFPIANQELRFSQISAAAKRQPKNQTVVSEDAESSAIRVVIADSNELSRWGYSGIIETDLRFKVISELSDWSTLRKFLEDIHVDVLIISHTLNGGEDGFLNLKQLSRDYPKLQILLLSNYTEYTFASQAIEQGADAYLLKTSGSEEILTALDALAAGKQYISKAILVPKQRLSTTGNNNTVIEAFSTLTEREREIFYYVLNGKTNQEIANELVISTRTVESHRLNMMRKLGLTGTAALINFAINKGLDGKHL